MFGNHLMQAARSAQPLIVIIQETLITVCQWQDHFYNASHPNVAQDNP